ncbi:MAG: hypothetical protein DRN08_02595, partial [Thermoplasmata archaeon]
VYAYNNTHNSEGYNATFIVKQVTVTCDKTPLIWKHDDNISATFTITYEGEPINGTLLIDNMTLNGDYYLAWANTSFDGSADTGGNDSVEIDEDEVVNGVVTVDNITADYLPPGEAEMNITFWFKPESPHDGAFARALGVLPVSIPTVTPDKQYVPVGRTTTVTVTVTGRGQPLDNIFISLSGQGVDQNATSDSEGKAVFSILPTSTGNVSIKVENRTSDTVITVTSWVLDITTDPISQVDEGATFKVIVKKEGTDTPVEGADVTFNGQTVQTDANGEATFTAPEVTSDRTFTITVTAVGYAPDPDGLTITVINIPKLLIATVSSVTAGSTFEVTVADDTGSPIIGATVTFNENTYTTGAGGIAKLKAPEKTGNYTITATFGSFKSASITIQVKKAPGIPGFELITLIAAIGVAFILLRRRQQH